MKVFAIATVIASVTTTSVGLGLIAGAPVDLVPVGYRVAEMLPFVVLQLAFTAVGATLVLRRPENRVGHLLCGTALVSSVLIVTSALAVRALANGDMGTAGTAAWIASWSTLGIGVTFGPALLIFPDGRIRSIGARAALVALGIAVVLAAIAVAFRPGPLSTFPTILNPYPWRGQGPLLDVILGLGLAAGLIATLLGLGSQVARSRRSSGIERQQLKWFLASAAVVALGLVPAMALMYGETQPATAAVQRYAGRAIGALTSAAMPIAVGVAILRYRLYDIDILIHRTLVYGAMSAVLLATYVAGVLVLQTVLRPLTAGSDVAVAASTLLVVTLFQPIRGRVQDIVDRRFYRSRYDATRTVDAFTARLRNDVELDSVRSDLLVVVAETVRPAHASLWLRRARRS
jgi:hypothetical protein